jgi:uncharacterized delta-60 repeat protein
MGSSRDYWATPSALTAGPRALAVLAASFLAPLILLVFVPLASAHSGDLAWQRVYNGSGNGQDAYYAAAAAPKGGVYAAGTTLRSTADFLIVRYDANGQLVWRRAWDDPTAGVDVVEAVAGAPGGGLVVAGLAGVSPTEVIAVARYSAAGKRLWVRLYQDAGVDQQYTQKVAVDAAGNVYVLAQRFATVTRYDIVLLKYSPAGKRRWVRRYVTPGDDFAYGMALDARGDVYLTGVTPGTNGTDALTLKYSPSGTRRWARLYDGPAGGDDAAGAIAVTGAGTAYVAGDATGISTGSDAVVLKYTSAGALRWSRFQSGAGAQDDGYQGIALAANGDVVATGGEFSATTANDVLTVRLSPGGHTRWARLYNGPDNFADNGSLVGVAPTGAIFIEGFSYGAATNADWLTLRYSAAGKRAWVRRYTSAGSALDFSNALVVRAGSVFVAGVEDDAANQNAALLRYKP